MEEYDMGGMGNNSSSILKKRRFWQVHLEALKKSGLSQNEYCRRNQLSSSQLGYWKKKLRNHDHQATPQNFILVPVSRSKFSPCSNRDDSGLTIVISNKMHIRLESNFSPSALSKVIAVLGGQA